MILFLCYWGLFLGEKCIIVYTINYRKSFGTESLDMKKYLIISAIFIAWWFSPAFAEENPQAALPVVLLELFTSQGCYSCPPAEKLLGEDFARRPHVMALELHVDYWDDLVYGFGRRLEGSFFPERLYPKTKGLQQKNTQYRKRFYAASHRARQIQRQRHQSREYQ